MDKLVFLQWNLRGIQSRKEDLETILQQHNPRILALQETFLKSGQTIKVKNFNIEMKNRSNRSGGGVMMCIHKSLSYKRININSTLEIVGVKVFTKHEQYNVFSMYIPPEKNLETADLESLHFNQYKNILILGDFNSHNHAWGSPRNDKKSEKISGLDGDHPEQRDQFRCFLACLDGDCARAMLCIL